MECSNREIAALLDQVADLLELDGANPFRIRAYRNAAYTLAQHPDQVADLVAAGADLTVLPGIGADLGEKLATIVTTGRLPLLDELRQKHPMALTELLQISGLGPKRVKQLYEALNVRSLADLQQALAAGKIRELPGFGEKSEAQIRRSVDLQIRKKPRVPLGEVEDVAQLLHERLRRIPGVQEVVIAGSYRRRRDTVGDLDVLVAARDSTGVMEAFVAQPRIREVVAQGDTRATLRLEGGLQVDLRVVPAASFGAALQYLTGSRSHSIALRQIAAEKKLKLNEYGVWKGRRRIAGETEEAVYAALGLPWIPPELRENRGEIEAARDGRLPSLVTLAEIRGDLHAHTRESDGRDSLETMVEAARRLGYQYLAITDHSPRLKIAHGMSLERIQAQIEAIDRLNEALGEPFVLKGCEVDILEDGQLDLPDRILKQLDLSVCSVHGKFDLPEKAQTERIIRAMDNPYFSILGHPTGRLLGRRDPYSLDLEAVLEAARERGCVVELDGHPQRLDLTDLHCRLAREHGVLLSISTDAHTVHDLGFMHYGVEQARRAWLEATDILNTRPRGELLQILSARRRGTG